MRGIYHLLHESGRQYIGSSVDVGKRLADHRRDLERCRHTNARLQACWNKYGAASFVFEALEMVEGDLELAEQNWLLSKQPELNLTFEVRAPMRGKKASPELRAKLSASHKGPLSDSHRQAIVAANLRRRGSSRPDLLGRRLSPEHAAKIRGCFKGHTEESKRKISEALRGKKASPERYAKLVEHNRRLALANKGRTRSESTKAKLRAAALAQWAKAD